MKAEAQKPEDDKNDHDCVEHSNGMVSSGSLLLATKVVKTGGADFVQAKADRGSAHLRLVIAVWL